MGKVRFSNPKTLAPPPGYSYVVEATGPGRIIYFAGQLGVDIENKWVGADFRTQCHAAFDNMSKALKAGRAEIEKRLRARRSRRLARPGTMS